QRGRGMKPVIACSALSLALSGCSTVAEKPLSETPPFEIENGPGSQHGNYAARLSTASLGADGERCVTYNWDRPLANGLALRMRSASCASRERPGLFVARELSRTIIPLSESNLQVGQE